MLNAIHCAGLFRERAKIQPHATALVDGQGRALSYGDLVKRVESAAGALRSLGVKRGDRVAVWSENRFEYIELELAAAYLGAIVACLNWRLSDAEQRHCIELVSPRLVIVSEKYQAAWARLQLDGPRVLVFGPTYERLISSSESAQPDPHVDPEDGLVILYTSGTTGLPKGALISQRAMVARAMLFSSEFSITARESFIAWSPLFHMASTDHSLATLMLGGKVLVLDGVDEQKICEWISREPIGWLMAMPGMIVNMIEALRRCAVRTVSIRMVGAMADLVPLQQMAQLTSLLNAPYLNSFGSTETGLAPASGSTIAPGDTPKSLAKRQSSWCLVRLVDIEGRDVADGQPGELAMRGPTLFSGYWENAGANAESFRNGWFHMGDVFVRHPDGTLDFVDRVKYLIKSGGENIYPAEIERVLLSHPRVREAAVTRKSDPRWGEVPVAFVACDSEQVDAEELTEFCRARLAGYKRPKEIRFIPIEEFPRSSTGKVQRHELEKRL